MLPSGFCEVISGQLKGRRLWAPKAGIPAPPRTGSRESLFNILNSDLGGLAVLDLYAEPAPLGLEALSRGADRAVFIDFQARAVARLET